jgi:hypothetical protein
VGDFALETAGALALAAAHACYPGL